MRHPHPARPTDSGAALLGTRALFQAWAQYDGHVYWGGCYPSLVEAETAAAGLLDAIKDPERGDAQGRLSCLGGRVSCASPLTADTEYHR